MKKKAFWLLAAFVFTGFGFFGGSTVSASQVLQQPFSENPEAIEQAASSVFMLEIYDRDDVLITRGSGFAAFSDKTLVTSCHVIENMEYLIAVTDTGERIRVDTVVNADTGSDIAVCAFPEDVSYELLLPCAQEPLRGEPSVVIGSVRGIVNLVTIGNICGCWETGDINWVLFSSPVSQGQSGGPLLNDKGEVIGVVIGSYHDMQNLNLAAPIGAVEKLWEESTLSEE